ncbi:nuclear transport factor 2 family protein [Pedobacter polaris]|uniref:Nuclear transport factor 2 family protein n=1 Tax=Pedobacter polaris TaxID=2571273 RepID=A0A4U1CTL5_9SPHI|nr:nuclear transport factor 2 family protein [Pedobacter polaris]TKC12123.1 nuclear transport factor 2 family protein [Pedobacter polaris]
MKKFIYTLLFTSLSVGVSAQKADGTTKSLVAAERAFAADAVKDGANAAFTKYAADDALVFRPNPINAKKFYATAPDMKDLDWTPVQARVSRSGDWGFTSGSYVVGTDKKSYGHYLSVWRVNDGKWEFILDLGAETNKALSKPTTNFVEPKDHYIPKYANGKDLKVSREVINTTEKTLNTTLKSFGASAFAGFLNNDARLLFPGTEPLIGKENIQAFCNRMIDKINLKTTAFDKALGGDFAYTYGVATIDYKTDLRESFNYIFIWERQSDGNWNIMTQIFTLAER